MPSPRPSERVRYIAMGVGAPLLAAVLVASIACRSRPPEKRTPAAADVLAALQGYADIAFAEYSDSTTIARDLLTAVEAFVGAPSESGLTKAREAWVAARVPYMQTEAFRFYGGPIDRVETLVNTWPIDESYIESPSGRLGIVDDEGSYPELSEASLTALNMKEGETSVTTGFHAIEFLLWGQDRDANGPGARSYTDYVADSAAAKGSKVARRRGQYLLATTRLLVRHLYEVTSEWAPGKTDNYRSRFLSLPRQEALGLALKGMGTLSGPEMSGERLTVAYETKDQENEHSCFSDNTNADLAWDAVGIQNLCSGKYRRASGNDVDGPGLCKLVASVDPALGAALTAAIGQSVISVRGIPAPFDRAIMGGEGAPGRVAVHRAIVSLTAQANALTKAAAALGSSMPLASTGLRR